MKKLLFPILIALGLLFAGCGDDNGTDGNGNGPVGPVRVVVDTTVTKPTFTDVNEAVWSNVAGKNIEIGGSTTYGVDPNLTKQNVLFKAIKKSDTLYLWVRWYDATANIRGDYLLKSSWLDEWTQDTDIGEDKFFIIFDGQDNGTERADCASMCHATEHRTTGGGTVDTWEWGSSRTAPGFMAEDGYWNANTSDSDKIAAGPTINDFVWRRNYADLAFQPYWMHPSGLLYEGAYLYRSDAIAFNKDLDWQTNDAMPGYSIDTLIYKSPDRRSMWDVNAISEFDDSGTSPSEYTWTVVFRRALNTGNNDDVNLATLDSVEVAIAATHNVHNYFKPPVPIPHSGSKPFWLILKP